MKSRKISAELKKAFIKVFVEKTKSQNGVKDIFVDVCMCVYPLFRRVNEPKYKYIYK